MFNTQVFNSAFLADIMWFSVTMAIAFTYVLIQKRKNRKNRVLGPMPTIVPDGPKYNSDEWSEKIKQNEKRQQEFEAAQKKFIDFVDKLPNEDGNKV
jgi:hypothetical protein